MCFSFDIHFPIRFVLLLLYGNLRIIISLMSHGFWPFAKLSKGQSHFGSSLKDLTIYSHLLYCFLVSMLILFEAH